MAAAEYRAKARELRELASTTHDEKTRADLLVVADQYDSLAKNASGQWMIPVWPDVPAANPLAYFFTWRLEVNGGSNHAVSQLLHSDVKLGGVSQGEAKIVPLKKAGKNILFNYNQMNFPVGIQLVVNINPPVTSAVDTLVKGGPVPTH